MMRRPAHPRRIAILATLVALAAGGGAWHLGARDGAPPVPDGDLRHVDGYVKVAETRRIVVEAADGRLHTLEVDRRRLEQLDVAHIRAHSHLGHAMRLSYITEGGRSWVVDTRDLDDFPGVSRAPARAVSERDIARIRPGQPRARVEKLLGPALVPGFGDTWKGRRADCWQWAISRSGDRFVACFDPSSDPAVLGTSVRRS